MAVERKVSAGAVYSRSMPPFHSRRRWKDVDDEADGKADCQREAQAAVAVSTGSFANWPIQLIQRVLMILAVVKRANCWRESCELIAVAVD